MNPLVVLKAFQMASIQAYAADKRQQYYSYQWYNNEASISQRALRDKRWRQAKKFYDYLVRKLRSNPAEGEKDEASK